jgi:hypothetical protein
VVECCGKPTFRQSLQLPSSRRMYGGASPGSLMQDVGGKLGFMVLIGGAEEWAAIQWERSMFL